MNFNIQALKERQHFLNWLAARYPSLAQFDLNIDRALIKGRKMTINNYLGISFNTRQLLISALKEYYLQQTGQQAINNGHVKIADSKKGK